MLQCYFVSVTGHLLDIILTRQGPRLRASADQTRCRERHSILQRTEWRLWWSGEPSVALLPTSVWQTIARIGKAWKPEISTARRAMCSHRKARDVLTSRALQSICWEACDRGPVRRWIPWVPPALLRVWAEEVYCAPLTPLQRRSRLGFHLKSRKLPQPTQSAWHSHWEATGFFVSQVCPSSSLPALLFSYIPFPAFPSSPLPRLSYFPFPLLLLLTALPSPPLPHHLPISQHLCWLVFQLKGNGIIMWRR